MNVYIDDEDKIVKRISKTEKFEKDVMAHYHKMPFSCNYFILRTDTEQYLKICSNSKIMLQILGTPGSTLHIYVSTTLPSKIIFRGIS